MYHSIVPCLTHTHARTYAHRVLLGIYSTLTDQAMFEQIPCENLMYFSTSIVSHNLDDIITEQLKERLHA